ncbi:hypothetical protein [uncultured Litoreibacter sp.]|uniref:hypothetical protein n=1 Tax=uncultured Litoreibacter sp. TaxID=1392394 RepID=UPI0026171705|nr:hypothetical protein [uncultured Litoreibacter sp.]
MKLTVSPLNSVKRYTISEPKGVDIERAISTLVEVGGDIALAPGENERLWARTNGRNFVLAIFDGGGDELGSFTAHLQKKIDAVEIPPTIEINGDLWPTDVVCNDPARVCEILIYYLGSGNLLERHDWIMWD